MATMDNLRRLECAWDPRRCGEGSFSAVYRGGTKSQGLATHAPRSETTRPEAERVGAGRGPPGGDECACTRQRVRVACAHLCARASVHAPVSRPSALHRHPTGASEARALAGGVPAAVFPLRKQKQPPPTASRTPAGPGSGDSLPSRSQWGSCWRVTLIQRDVAGPPWDLSEEWQPGTPTGGPPHPDWGWRPHPNAAWWPRGWRWPEDTGVRPAGAVEK